MKHTLKKALCLLCALAAVCLCRPAMAAGSASASLSYTPEGATVGQTVTVELVFESTGEDISSLQASFSYDAAMLEFVSGGNAVGGSGGFGGISDTPDSPTSLLSYDLRFRVLQAGTASFSLTSSEVVGYVSGAVIGSPKGSLSLTLGSAAEPLPDPSLTDPVAVDIGGKTYHILVTLSQAQLPEGFSLTQISYSGATVPAGIGDETGLTILQMMDEGGAENFYILDRQTGEFTLYREYAFLGQYVPLPAEQPPAEFPTAEKALLSFGKKGVTGYITEDGLSLVYAAGPDGLAGWYVLDPHAQTLSRLAPAEDAADDPSASPAPEGTPALPAAPIDAGVGSDLILVGLGAAAIVLLIVLIALARKAKRQKEVG
ncbi:MAG: hypothetical protein IJP03_02825 [Christensenellaceae bacterium]|nr:hypothetical protein [Christensenellaceae bacterium]